MTTFCSCIDNAGGGIVDWSFLGNTHIGNHVRGNGVRDPVLCGNPVGACSYGGKKWFVIGNKTTEASTTTPGTDDTVWREFSTPYTPPTWVSGMTWKVGAPYATNPDNLNARTIFLGCYAESGDSFVQITYPSVMIGGHVDNIGKVGTGWLGMATQQGGVYGANFVATPNPHTSGERTSFGDPENDQWIGHERGTDVYRWRVDGNERLIFESNNVNKLWQMGLENDTSALGPRHSAFATLYFGHINQGINRARLLMSFSNLSDLNGLTMQRGDLFVYELAGTGNPPMYMCTTAGVYGSGAKIAPFGNLGTAIP
jgi:hypothetical protein